MTVQFEWKLSNPAEDLSAFVKAFSTFLSSSHIKHKEITQWCLVLDEIITNIFSYGFQDSKKHHSIYVKTNILSDIVQTTIIDDGIPFDPTKQPPPDITSSLEDRPIGGLGLHLVKSFMDNVHYQHENGHNILKLVKKLGVHEDIQMEIVEIINEQVVTVMPKGRIDSVTSTDFDSKITDLLAKGLIKVIIDFSGTDFISSAGLRVLLMKAKQAKNLSGKIVLSNMSESIDEVFEVSGFSTIFNIYKTAEEAMKALKSL